MPKYPKQIRMLQIYPSYEEIVLHTWFEKGINFEEADCIYLV